MRKLQNKVAFITGGSRGMGAGIASHLSAEGATVVFTHSGKNTAKATAVLKAIQANDSRGAALVANNEQPEAILEALESTVKEFGTIDILINNAGMYMQKPLEAYTFDEFDQMIHVNVKAVFIASQFASRHMKSGSRIITIGSNMADRVLAAEGSLYAMSKSALIGLTKGMARDLGSRNITVNLIQPGPVNTDMNPEDSKHAPALKSVTALNRYGTVEEVAGLVAYLCSEESGFITGTSITMDGGFNT